jgi:RNA polymerase sigma-70 factor (ECF subfamily)
MSPSANKDDDKERFRSTVEPHLEVLLAVGRRLTANRADAEDLVQDTLTRAFRAIDGFDGRHPRAWLLTILRNTHINTVRRHRVATVDDPGSELVRRATPRPDDDPEHVTMVSLFDEVLSDALAALAAPQRAVVELVDLNGLSYLEAAAVLDVPIGTVMSRLHRARAKLRDDLEAAGFTPETLQR